MKVSTFQASAYAPLTGGGWQIADGLKSFAIRHQVIKSNSLLTLEEAVAKLNLVKSPAKGNIGKKKKKKPISKKEMGRRLIDIDIAQTSALRDLEMDIFGESGIESSEVLRAARDAIK